MVVGGEFDFVVVVLVVLDLLHVLLLLVVEVLVNISGGLDKSKFITLFKSTIKKETILRKQVLTTDKVI